MATWLFIGTIFGVVLLAAFFCGRSRNVQVRDDQGGEPPKTAGAWMWRQQTHREWLMHGRLLFMAAGSDWVLCK